MRHLLGRPPVRFLIVGAICAAVHNVIVVGGSFLGINYVYSTLVSYLIVVTIGFLLHTNFTFSREMAGDSFVRYALAMAANYPLSIACMFVLVNVMHIVVALASPLATAILIVWNYAASRWAIIARARSALGVPAARR